MRALEKSSKYRENDSTSERCESDVKAMAAMAAMAMLVCWNCGVEEERRKGARGKEHRRVAQSRCDCQRTPKRWGGVATGQFHE